MHSWVSGQACFPQKNGNESQSTTGDQEIDGATLTGPTLLTTGPCPQPHRGYPGGAWCTPTFTLKLSVPGSAGAKRFAGWGLLGQPLVGTSVVLPNSQHLCATCWSESLGLAGPKAVGYGAWWCLEAAIPGWAHGGKCGTESDSLRISGMGNHFETMAICATGDSSLITVQDVTESFTACIQTQLAPGGVAPPLGRSAASLVVDVSSPSFVPGRHVPLGRSGRVTVSVKALGGTVHAIGLGKGLVASSGAAVVVSAPAGLSGFTLRRGGSRQFVFGVKTVKPGVVMLSAQADGKASSGGVVHGSGDLTAIVVPGFVVNTVSDAVIDPKALSRSPPECAIDVTAAKPLCSLRAAVQLVNSLGGKQGINFDIPGAGVPRIAPASPLPAVSASVTIDGTTQGGGWVELSGRSAGGGNGLELDGPGSTVSGLVINGFAKGAGVLVAKGSGDVIAGDRIGSDPSGEAAVANMFGVEVQAPGVTIGGTDGTSATTCAGDCDLLSGNSELEVVFDTGGSGKVIGDTVGPDLTGTKVLNWNYDGLVAVGPLDDSQHPGTVIIGGATSAPGVAPGNLIAGGSLGVLYSATASGGVVAGNLIGLNRSGTASLEGSLLPETVKNNLLFRAYSDHGVVPYGTNPYPENPISSASSGVWVQSGRGHVVGAVVVGGVLASDADVISGFPVGVSVPAGGLVEHDLIGTNAAGTAGIGNLYGVLGDQYGVLATGGVDGEVIDSVVSGNLLDGVAVHEVVGSRIGTNSDGTAAVPNGLWGVVGVAIVGGVRAAGSRSCSDPCNVISGNRLGGVELSGKVEGNFIGTDIAGTAAIPNGDYWATAHGHTMLATETPYPQSSAASSISALGGSSRAASGVCDLACNLISGNDQPGVQLIGGTEPTMQGNVIGRSITGTPLPNHGDGVLVVQADKVGVIDSNLIADNSGAAINLPQGGTAPTIEGNSITGNANGIYYGPGTVAPLPPSMLPLMRGAGGQVTLSGDLPSFLTETAKALTPARVDVYASPGCGSQRQGKVPLGTATASHTGGWTFTASGIASSLTAFMTTVTIDGSTSVYSACAH